MAEPFYRFAERIVPPVVAILENLVARGGALLAQNHTGYLDWLPTMLATRERGLRLYFMIKAEMVDAKAVNYVMRHARLIPVDRRAGRDAFDLAVQRLREGELIGMHPEATIGRGYELREFKTGAARMAVEAQVPIIPVIVWGAHRNWPKDHPKKVFRACRRSIPTPEGRFGCHGGGAATHQAKTSAGRSAWPNCSSGFKSPVATASRDRGRPKADCTESCEGGPSR